MMRGFCVPQGLDAPLIGAFLTHLEHDRHNSARTRNNRLAAIHSLYRYAALEHPEQAATIARVMVIPTKRYQRNEIYHSAANQADTDPPTRSSRSSKRCDYADQLANQNPAEQQEASFVDPHSA